MDYQLDSQVQMPAIMKILPAFFNNSPLKAMDRAALMEMAEEFSVCAGDFTYSGKNDHSDFTGILAHCAKMVCLMLEDVVFWETMASQVEGTEWVHGDTFEEKSDLIRIRKENYGWKGYDCSYTNPRFSSSVFGSETGPFLSAMYYTLQNSHWSALKGRMGHFRLYREVLNDLVMGLEDLVSIDSSKNTDAGQLLSPVSENWPSVLNEIVRNCLSNLQRSAMLLNLEDMDSNHDPESNRERALIRDFAELGEKILSLRPFTPHSEAILVQKALSSLASGALEKTASELFSGFRRSVVNASLTLEKGDTIHVNYVEGMEPIISVLAGLIEGMGYNFLGTCSSIVKDNHQESYDHRCDFHFVMDEAFTDTYGESMEKAYSRLQPLMKRCKGTILIEFFGEDTYNPEQHDVRLPFISENFTGFQNRSMEIARKYNPVDEATFTVAALPHPHTGPDAEILLKKSMGLIALPLKPWEDAQQRLLSVLDYADSVHVTGRNGSTTDITVALQRVDDPARQTPFCSVLADLNFPLGEVFTSPKLTGTNGVLHVPGELYVAGLPYRDLTLTYKDGIIVDYSCSNFDSAEDGRAYLEENLFNKKTGIPMGEFAIGTNRILDQMVKDHNIPSSKLSVLLIEKMGPHFAFGDTCYLMRETRTILNPDGREVLAKYNDISMPNPDKPDSERYFLIHVDVTLPYDYTGEIAALLPAGDGSHERVTIVRDGVFVLPGTEVLNTVSFDDPILEGTISMF
ncbi:MAG: hypothetical protein CVV64_04205 [Candidatus Wallbacteria bacterium HGW-Wallbacteria-1]|jgi:hypothetical protein|uniref:Uncharacterized protein n=1 Tax=Candidatus Wallbacteria bacterium HGW-Wallbacteria-1 TaxID=2013854 RepID=A0A2N1PRK7_9BACT|nr:MAG: hypothetical protein CVV64_04205 [Candidatus Wallbacteria bacterium HGW-Wallbacteria-1]